MGFFDDFDEQDQDAVEEEKRRKILASIVSGFGKPPVLGRRAPDQAPQSAAPPSVGDPGDLFGRSDDETQRLGRFRLREMPVDPGFAPKRDTLFSPPSDAGFSPPRTPQFPPALGRSTDTTVWGAPAPYGVIPGTDAPRPAPPAGSRPTLASPREVTPDAQDYGEWMPPYREARPGPPRREDFPAGEELSGWKKYLALGLATLAGTASGKPELTGSLAERIFHGQRDEAERRYQQGEQEFERGQAGEERAARIENIRSEIKARETPKAEKPENLDREAYDFYIAGGMSPAEARKQVLKDASEAKPEKPEPEKVPPHITVLGKDGQPHIMERDPKSGEYSVDRGRAPQEMGGREERRSDDSYKFHSGRIDKLREPVEARLERITRLVDTLNQGTPQADALIAPELLTAMAGGQGSGLRMNEAEIARIVGGRTNWESIKSKVQAWQADPNKGFALTPDQRQQVRGLMTVVTQRVHQKMQAIDEESQNLLNSDDPKEHRRIYNHLQKRLSDVDRAGTLPEAGGAPSGKSYTQADVDAAARQYGKTPQEIERAFQAKGWAKK